MKVDEQILKALEQYASSDYSAYGYAFDACGEASGCNSSSGECACHGDGYVW